MTWLRNNTTCTVRRLQTDINYKSSYIDISTNLNGFIKKITLTDWSFDVANIDGTAYKLSLKWFVDVKPSDRVIIATGVYEWEYGVQDLRYTQGVTFDTTHILIIK